MKNLVKLSFLTLVALMLSYIESIIPMPVPVPGIKLGLANLITLYLLLNGQRKGAFLVLITRTVLASLLFANPINLLYSLGGGLLALLIMSLLFKAYPKRLSLLGISVPGAMFHNIGQIAVACILMRSLTLIYYLPILILVGIITGILIALLGSLLFKRLINCSTWNNACKKD